ncbi:MAG: DUF3617 domain-containing protein [Rhodopseudomonas palustris]|nr:DUF3617 domain-containing protein [Rhodopseudomonas palustris]
MTRGCAWLALAPAFWLATAPAVAIEVEMPNRKPGLWEMKMVNSGVAGMTMQHCTDEVTDKQLRTAYSPMAKEICSKNVVQKTATGYITDAVATVGGVTMNSHSVINGDFNSAYTVNVSSDAAGRAVGSAPQRTSMTLEAKWLGPCRPEQEAGRHRMPGGFKLNVNDMDKLKGLPPR